MNHTFGSCELVKSWFAAQNQTSEFLFAPWSSVENVRWSENQLRGEENTQSICACHRKVILILSAHVVYVSF